MSLVVVVVQKVSQKWFLDGHKVVHVEWEVIYTGRKERAGQV
jgi:hypothetical protein